MEHQGAPKCNRSLPPTLALCLDQGGSSSRALVFDTSGRVLASAQRAVGETRPSPEQVEQDPEALVSSLEAVADEAWSQLGPAADQIGIAGLATQRASALAYERSSGRALTPVYSWQDRRAQALCEARSRAASRIAELTGLRLSPHYGASKFAWAWGQFPSLHERWRSGDLCWSPLAGFLARRLSVEPEARVDPVNATRSLLMDLEQRAWSAELCELWGVPIDALPRISTQATRLARLPLDLNLVTGDQAAALYAAGEPQPDELLINLGTGAFVQRCMRSALRAEGLLTSLVRVRGAQADYAMEGTINGAGVALTRFAAAAQLGEPAQWQALLEAELRSARPRPLYINADSGLAAPYWRSELSSSFVGTGSALACLAAVAESIVFLIGEIEARMRIVLGPAQRVVLSGGLSRLPSLCQLCADVLGIPVLRREESEATARGLAWLLLGGCFARGLEQRYEPRADPSLRERHAAWRRALQTALG